MIKVGCSECDWWDKLKASEIAPLCPHCGGDIERQTEPTEPETTKTDKI